MSVIVALEEVIALAVRLIPTLAWSEAVPVPVRMIGPFVPVVEMAPPLILMPCEAAVRLGPPIPFNVITPPDGVLIDPPVIEMPWQAPRVPLEVEVIVIALAAKFALDANPTPFSPRPVMEVVAKAAPVVEKAAPTLMPFPPYVPPRQLVQTTGPAPANAPPRFRP